MIEQRLDAREEVDCVWQFGVSLKRRLVLPAGVNVELIEVSDRAKCAVRKATRLRARGALDRVNGVLQFASFSGASVESGKHKNFHDDPSGWRFSVSALSGLTFDVTGGRRQA